MPLSHGKSQFGLDWSPGLQCESGTRSQESTPPPSIGRAKGSFVGCTYLHIMCVYTVSRIETTELSSIKCVVELDPGKLSPGCVVHTISGQQEQVTK